MTENRDASLDLLPIQEPPTLPRKGKESSQLHRFALGYATQRIGSALLIQVDCFDWLRKAPENSLHAVVTDPPYGVKEYEKDQIEKRGKNLGIWRLPPAFDGHVRAPLPRFTALNDKERQQVRAFFLEWARLVNRVLRPGGHVFIASNAFLSQLVFSAVIDGGLEFRGELIRLVRTLRGGDRPKNAEEEFPNVSSLPRGCYEPWGVFRKVLPTKMQVSQCLRVFETGGLRRKPNGNPFEDVLPSERTPQKERGIVNHPSLKPQSFLRQIVHSALPLGRGIILDPFMGSGSTIAAAEAVGASCVGLERHGEYYRMACAAIPKLAALKVDGFAAQSALPFQA